MPSGASRARRAKTDTDSFEWQWDRSQRWRNINPDTFEARDKNGAEVERGHQGSKPRRTVTTRAPVSRRNGGIDAGRRGRALVLARQVFQHGIAGVLGLGEGFERRAADPDSAHALIKRTP